MGRDRDSLALARGQRGRGRLAVAQDNGGAPLRAEGDRAASGQLGGGVGGLDPALGEQRTQDDLHLDRRESGADAAAAPAAERD